MFSASAWLTSEHASGNGARALAACSASWCAFAICMARLSGLPASAPAWEAGTALLQPASAAAITNAINVDISVRGKFERMFMMSLWAIA